MPQHSQATSEHRDIASSLLQFSTERASLVRSIATLDLRFQGGDLPEPDYRAQRQELLGRILGPGADDFASIRNQAE